MLRRQQTWVCNCAAIFRRWWLAYTGTINQTHLTFFPFLVWQYLLILSSSFNLIQSCLWTCYPSKTLEDFISEAIAHCASILSADHSKMTRHLFKIFARVNLSMWISQLWNVKLSPQLLLNFYSAPPHRFVLHIFLTFWPNTCNLEIYYVIICYDFYHLLLECKLKPELFALFTVVF